MEPTLFSAMAEGRLSVDIGLEIKGDLTVAKIDAFGVKVESEHRDPIQAQNDVTEKFRTALWNGEGVMERTF